MEDMRSLRLILAALLALGLAGCDTDGSSKDSPDTSLTVTEDTADSSPPEDTTPPPEDTSEPDTSAPEDTAKSEADTGEPDTAPDTTKEADTEADADAADTAEKPTLSVFIFAGQSNMVGVGETPSLTADQKKKVERAYIWLDDTIHMNPNRKKWSPLTPGFGATQNHFGPELAFGRHVRQAWPGRHFAIIKVAEGGTNLHTDWKARKGRLYKRLIKDVQQQMTALDKKWRATLVGMTWMQGESDAHGAAATAYEQNLKTFMNAVRTDLNKPELPITIGLIAPIDLWKKHETIRTAQQSVAQSIGHANTVDTAGYSRHADDPAHYDAQGQLRLGKNFGKALLELLP